MAENSGARSPSPASARAHATAMFYLFAADEEAARTKLRAIGQALSIAPIEPGLVSCPAPPAGAAGENGNRTKV